MLHLKKLIHPQNPFMFTMGYEACSKFRTCSFLPTWFETGSMSMNAKAMKFARNLISRYNTNSLGDEWRRADIPFRPWSHSAAYFPSTKPLQDDDWEQISLDQLRAWKISKLAALVAEIKFTFFYSIRMWCSQFHRYSGALLTGCRRTPPSLTVGPQICVEFLISPVL